MSDSVGSVSVDVVPDARGWSEKLRAQIRDKQVKVKADADTADAEEKLDRTARTRTAKIKADTSQLSKGASALDSFVGKLGLLPALAVTAGAALIPLGAAIGGVVAALAAPLAIAGGGATLFAFLGGAAIKQTESQQKKLNQLAKTVAGARTSLENAEKSAGKHADTSTAVANAQRRLNQATAEYNTQLAAVSPQQRGFLSALQDLKNTFSDMISGSTGKSLLAPFTEGLGILAYVLRASEPIISATAGAFSDLLHQLDQAVSTPGFERFIQRIAHQVGPDIKIFGHIIGDLAQGFGGLFLALDNKHLSGGVLKGVEQLTSNFADWANSRAARHDVREFFDYFHQVGPQVASTIGAVARGIGQMVEALAPLGPPVLKVVEGIARAINWIKPEILTALAGAFVGLVAFQKVGGFKAAGLLGRLGGPKGGVGGPLGGGVQKVFVVNMPPGGPGGEGGLGGALKKDGKYVPGVAGGLSGSEIGGMAGLFTTGVLAQTYLTHHELSTAQNLALSRSPGVYGHGGVPETPAQIRNGPHINYGKLAADANGYLTSTSNRFDVLRTHAAQASRQIDLIGPRTQQAAGVGIKAIDALQGRLDAVHDKKFAVIAQTQAAVASLERLQAMRIADKHFTVYQRNQLLEQAVGPGGGRGRPNPGGSGGGGGGGGTPVHIHLDDNGRDTLTGVIQRNYDANRDFERNHR